MTDPIRDALQRLIEAVVSGTIPDIRDAINHARAALAEPADAPAASPAEGEVAELVRWLRENAEDERQMSEATTRASLMLDRAAELLKRHAAPVLVPVAERPWNREGWCDERGRCWLCIGPDNGVALPCWKLARPSEYDLKHVWNGETAMSLPFHALPLPAPQGGEVEP